MEIVNKTSNKNVKFANRILEQIHGEFFSAEKKIDAKVQKLLEAAYDDDRKKLNEITVTMGFTNSKAKTLFAPDNIKAAEELNDIINSYSVQYPNNKFITDAQIVTICKKYNLIVAPPSCYIGDIPVKNQEEMANFKSHHDDCFKMFVPMTRIYDDIHRVLDNMDSYDAKAFIKRNIQYVKTLALIDPIAEHLDKRIHAYYRQAMLNNHYAHNDYDIFRNTKPLDARTSYFIAATSDLLDLQGYIINDNNEAIVCPGDSNIPSPIIPDPIVLKKVPKGAIIVTAWGLEAEDELVVNHKNN